MDESKGTLSEEAIFSKGESTLKYYPDKLYLLQGNVQYIHFNQ